MGQELEDVKKEGHSIGLVHDLTSYKKYPFQKVAFLSERFAEEVDTFTRRNSILTIYSSRKRKILCCPACLKAHMFKKVQEWGMDIRVFPSIKNLFKGEIGHRGYYLDQEKVIKI